MDRRLAGLPDVVQEAWQAVAPLREGRNVTLHERCDGCDLRCVIDPFRMEQVFRNILENSLAACSDPVEIGVAYSEATLDGLPALQIAVADNGPGLTPETEARIFEAFYTTRTQGTGLGMAIARRIVEGHGGRIEVGRSAAASSRTDGYLGKTEQLELALCPRLCIEALHL
jgi:signal transduction histidine kinase